MDGTCSTHRSNTILVRKPVDRWENIGKFGLKEMGCHDLDWTELAQDANQWWAVVNAVMERWDPLEVDDCLIVRGSIWF